MERGIIAMSGGVDSSVAALLMQQQGDTLQGVTLLLQSRAADACGSGSDAADAAKVCEKLKMPHQTWDLRDEFRRQVQDRFCACYRSGGTPNPCIDCNRYLKFGAMLDRALADGWAYIASGHYARVEWDVHRARWVLKKGLDAGKDQSYVLYSLNQDQLAHTLFPLGALTKEQARDIAQEQGFINARKKDSQDICFIPDGDYPAFLRRFTGKQYPGGDFLDENGQIVGRHSGAVDYTIGQRKGLGLAMGRPVYVCGKDMAANTVTVSDNDALFHTTLLADDWNFIPFDAPTAPICCTAKARSRMTEQPCTLYPGENGRCRVVFEEAQRALTPGQAVVLYDGDTVLGGGTIREVLK